MSQYVGYVIEQLIHEDEKLQVARSRRREQRRAARAQRRARPEEPAGNRRILTWSSLSPKQ